MEDLPCLVPAPPQTLQRKIKSDFKSLSKRDKNVLSIHHVDDIGRSLEIDVKTNSVTVTHYGDDKKIGKTFLVDSVSSAGTCDDVLISAIKSVTEKKDVFILSVSKGPKKKSELANRLLLHTLVNWLMEYVDVCSDKTGSMFSVRLSALEFNEEMDTVNDLGSTDVEGKSTSGENLLGRRCGDTETAKEIINQFCRKAQHFDHSKQQYLYTVHVYHHSSHCSISSSVSTHCSRISVLLMDLTKQRNTENCLSPPGLAKILMAALNRNFDKVDIQSKFQNILFDITRKCSSNFAMITHLSAKGKHASDSYQLLQLASRIQRVKVKSKKSWEHKDQTQPSHPTMGTNAYKKGDKYSDTEVASTSEMSCAETVIFLGEERRRNSDDESRRFRSIFMSSDSDSGYRDWKISQVGRSQGTTPINESKKLIRLRTNALVWPKSALRMAKTALMNGEELWVDGPNATKKDDQALNMSESTSSTPETIKQPCCQNVKPIMICQETQCDDLTSFTGKITPEEIRPLSDISEVTEDNDTLKNANRCQHKDEMRFKIHHSQYQFNQNEYSNLERSDAKNLSNWIHDVNELTSNQELLSRSVTDNMSNRHFLPVRNESLNSHSYQYYDPGSMGEYNSFPRVYTQIQYTEKTVNHPITVRCHNLTPESEKEVTSPDYEHKFNKIYKKKDSKQSTPKERNPKTKSFSPLEILKKTLMRKKKKSMPDSILETQCCITRCPELTYLRPAVASPDDSSDSTSSESECNEWFRNVKTFKSKADYTKNKCISVRPPSAPLLAGSGSALRSQYSFRQRSSSSGYGSVVTRDSEVSSHHDSTSDQSIHGSLQNTVKQSLSFSHQLQHNQTSEDPAVIAQRCELLVKQEKALLLIQQQEIMVQDFYQSTRPLLTIDPKKYTIRISSLDINRVTTDNQYLEELEEDTNIIRDSIAFYKSLVHLESSFVTSPDAARRNIR